MARPNPIRWRRLDPSLSPISDAYRNAPGGKLSEMLIRNVLPEREAQIAREKYAADQQQFRRQSDADPWYRAADDKILHGAAALGGQIAGSMVSPETVLAPGIAGLSKLSKAGQAAAVFTGAARNALSNGVDNWLTRQLDRN
jgi:hypothetical protein